MHLLFIYYFIKCQRENVYDMFCSTFSYIDLEHNVSFTPQPLLLYEGADGGS